MIVMIEAAWVVFVVLCALIGGVGMVLTSLYGFLTRRSPGNKARRALADEVNEAMRDRQRMKLRAVRPFDQERD